MTLRRALNGVEEPNWVMLEDLPESDSLRTTPLHVIGAEYFHVKDPTVWRAVTPDKFWGFSYNDLTSGWRDFCRWRAPNKEPR